MAKKKKAPERSPAEEAYGRGERAMPPMLTEMSPASRRVARAGFSRSMSGWKTREEAFAASGAKGALEPGQISRLTDAKVTVASAASNVAGSWKRMLTSSYRPDPAWYFGHNRRLTRVAEQHGLNPETVIDASGAMSPQNDPDSEFRAASAMADAITKGRVITDPSIGRRKMTTLSPDEMQRVTATENVPNVSHAADFDLPGFRSAGTNRRTGWRTMLEPGYNAVEEMKAAKVHLYTRMIKASTPDSPLHHEYEARLGDQEAAVKVEQARKADRRSGVTGSQAIRGVPDRVDLYGLAKGGSDPTDPAYHHPVLGTRGLAVPDTWMSALLSGQEMYDEPGSSSPAKAAGSQTATTHASLKGTTFMSPAEAKAAGGKELTGGAVWGMAALEAIQGGAVKARHPESQTNIPPVMLQEMTWTHERGEVAKSTEAVLEAGGHPGSTVAAGRARIGRLTRGTLEGEKEFRPSTAPPSAVPRIETPGMFSRGYDNPLDTDAVTVRPRSSPVTPSHVATVETAHADLARFHENAVAAAPDDFTKRRAILKAITSHSRMQRR